MTTLAFDDGGAVHTFPSNGRSVVFSREEYKQFLEDQANWAPGGAAFERHMLGVNQRLAVEAAEKKRAKRLRDARKRAGIAACKAHDERAKFRRRCRDQMERDREKHPQMLARAARLRARAAEMISHASELENQVLTGMIVAPRKSAKPGVNTPAGV